MPSEIEVYTAICGGYEQTRSDVRVFTDSPADKFLDPVMNAKVYKVLPHKFIASPLRIWVDGNIFPLKEPAAIVAELLRDSDIAAFRHPARGCLFAEHAPARARLRPECRPLIDEQVAQYRREGMPEGFGLAECGVLISRASEATREFFERWWVEITRYSSRDQMSFPYVWWRMRDRIKVSLISAPTRFGDHFRWVSHGKG